MKTSGSGRKANNVRTVTITFTGTDTEFIKLIDQLDTIASTEPHRTRADLVTEIMRSVNWYAGTPVDHKKPRRTIDL